MKVIKLLTISIIFICTILIYFAFSEEQITGEDKIMSTWLEWKVNHIYDPQKKEVIKYFKAIDAFFNASKETQFVAGESDYGNSDPKKAIRIVENSLRETKRLKVPQNCMHYHELTIKILQNIKNYHASRLKFGDNQIFWEKVKADKLNQIKREAEREGEYFNILRNIGFYDNMIDELQQLKLITKEELDKFKSEK